MSWANKPVAVDSLLICSICKDFYKDPRKVPCGHTFCLSCIPNNTDFKCSICTNTCKLLASGPQGLRPNFLAINFIKSFKSVTDCSEDKQHERAQYLCIDCWDPFCNNCGKHHTKFNNMTKHHKLKKWAEIDKEDFKQHSEQLTYNCTKHENEKVNAYCKNCEEILCQTCMNSSHYGHIFISLTDADKEFIKNIKQSLEIGDEIVQEWEKKLTEITDNGECMRKDFDQVTNDIQTFTDKVKNEIKRACENIIENIDNSKTAMLKKVKALKDQCKTKIEDEKKNISENLKEGHNYLEFYTKYLPPLSSAIDRGKKDKKVPTIVKPNENRIIFYQFPGVSIWKNAIIVRLMCLKEAMKKKKYNFEDLITFSHLDDKETYGVNQGQMQQWHLRQFQQQQQPAIVPNNLLPRWPLNYSHASMQQWPMTMANQFQQYNGMFQFLQQQVNVPQNTGTINHLGGVYPQFRHWHINPYTLQLYRVCYHPACGLFGFPQTFYFYN